MSDTEQDVLLCTTQDHVTTVSLNRPKQLNALSNALRAAITSTFLRLRDDDETHVIILTGIGRGFSAGLDLKELGQAGLRSGVSSADLHSAVTGVGKPIIAAINGFAITGGFELALMCDILIASTEARFADTHVRMGGGPRLGFIPAPRPLNRCLARQRAELQRQLSGCGNGGTLGAGKPGVTGRRVTQPLPTTGAGYLQCRSINPADGPPVDRLWLPAQSRRRPARGAQTQHCPHG